MQWTQRQPHLVLRTSGVDRVLCSWPCIFPMGQVIDYISLSKLPIGFSVIFKLGKVREILVSFISGKVLLYCPSVQSKTTRRLWALFQEQSSPRMYLFVRGGIIIVQAQKQYVLLPVPFHVFVLVLLCF